MSETGLTLLEPVLARLQPESGDGRRSDHTGDIEVSCGTIIHSAVEVGALSVAALAA